jgi:hypothetical protein
LFAFILVASAQAGADLINAARLNKSGSCLRGISTLLNTRGSAFAASVINRYRNRSCGGVWAASASSPRSSELRIVYISSTRTFGDKADSQEGNSPEPSLRSKICRTLVI